LVRKPAHLCILSAFDLNFLFLFKGKEIKEKVSLPHLYPRRSQREGEDLEGREGEDGRKFPLPSMSSPLSKGRGGFGESPTYILPLPKGGGGRISERDQSGWQLHINGHCNVN